MSYLLVRDRLVLDEGDDLVDAVIAEISLVEEMY
jgi:hypothetical protein